MNWLCQNYNKQKRGGVIISLTRGAVFGLLFAVAPFVFAVPTYAADDSTVSVTVDQNAALQPAGNLYKATANVTVKTSKSFGFNLTMQADTADLINSKDQTHKISSTPSTTPVALNANQWGYSLSKSATTFGAIPAATSTATQSGATATPAVIVDTSVKGKQAGCNCKDQCTTSVTFAANVDLAKLASGSYSTTITYTATAKPAPKSPVVDPTICKSGDSKNDCQVDLDDNMIPVKYTGDTTNAQWTSLANPEDSSNQGNWYNYNQKQWANAITVKDPSKYKGKSMVVEQSDILGYWVYIPRYAYEVMRRDVTDAPVPAQNFLIHFEKTTDPKRYPAKSQCAGRNMDYRTTCGLNRDYIKGRPSDQGTWATHPAFTFGRKELNGIWFAKFETTGTNTQPTILPNERHMAGYDTASYSIGRMYTTARTIGVADNNNIGGKTDYIVPTQNNHHLAKLSSHMINNNDWGAATYISASKYGAGYNSVQINANGAGHSDDNNNNNNNSYGTTGCGPQANGNTSKYENSGTFGTPQACGNADRAYNGTLGQLASTTNNPTGIYDMSGGGWEYVAASYTSNLSNSNTNQYFGSIAAHPPYVNTYNITNMNNCTFATCGGQALYETNNGSNNNNTAQWNGNSMYFVGSSFSWFGRGGGYGNGSNSGLFFAYVDFGDAGSDGAFRVALAPVAQD